MSTYRIRFVGPAALAVGVATALADAADVDLMSSERMSSTDQHVISLDLSVEGPPTAVGDAVSRIRADLPNDATIEIAAG